VQSGFAQKTPVAKVSPAKAQRRKEEPLRNATAAWSFRLCVFAGDFLCKGVHSFLLVLAMAVFSGAASAWSDPLDPFLPYLSGQAPTITKKLDDEIVGGVRVERVVFRSRFVPTSKGPELSLVFAIVATPIKPGRYPGLLILHGGRGSAEKERAIYWASRGYVAVAPDLPGIADPNLIPNSSGPWKSSSPAKYISANPDVTASPIFDAVVAAVQALYLLRSQKQVLNDRIGVAGVAWGGYVATMVSGLTGKSVRATFSVSGAGFYDRGSAWQKRLASLPKPEADLWLKYLDAGRRARGITGSYFVAAATNHEYYWPPAVNATLQEIRSSKNQLFAPNAVDSISLPGGNESPSRWLKMEELYFAFYLQGIGRPFPVVAIEKQARRDKQTVLVRFRVQGPPVQASAYYSLNDETWPARKWIKVPVVSVGNDRYEAAVPVTVALRGAHWLALASDAGSVTVSSTIEPVPNP
jgi:dienelactone hydrolase